MSERASPLVARLERHRLESARVVPARSLADRKALEELVRGLAPRGSVLSTCRNGVYRSSLVASALSRQGVSVLSEGTHSGLSYEFLLSQLQDAGTTPGAEGLALAGFDRPANLLVLCTDGASRDEVREIEQVLTWLSYFLNETPLESFALLVLEGPEEDHLYY